MFNLGDLVVCKPKHYKNYAVTNQDMKCAIVIHVDEDEIEIEVVEHTNPDYIDHTFYLIADHFTHYDPFHALLIGSISEEEYVKRTEETL